MSPDTARDNQMEEADFSDNEIDEAVPVLCNIDPSITNYKTNDLKAI